MSKIVVIGATALIAGFLCAIPLSLQFSPGGTVSVSADSASARIGRPLTPMSVAGVHRRAHRRAYYGYGYQPYSYYGYQGYAYQPSNRYIYQQQPYYGPGYRNWTQF